MREVSGCGVPVPWFGDVEMEPVRSLRYWELLSVRGETAVAFGEPGRGAGERP